MTDAGGNRSYVDADLTGNVVGLSGPNGQRSASYFYLPFGQVTQINGTANDDIEFAGAFGLVTSSTGLVSMRARFYNPALGKFLEQDPIGVVGGSNTYLYVASNPISDVDPFGTQATSNDIAYSLHAVASDGYVPASLSKVLDSVQHIDLNNIYAKVVLYGGAVVAAAKGTKSFLSDVKDSLGLIEEIAKSPVSKVVFSVLFSQVILDAAAVALVYYAIYAVTHRDPHLLTFDGLRYDFQTVGEFVLTQQTS